MGRLTNKNQIMEGFDGYETIKKLSDFEDIEEEFEIDLITLLKALDYGVWHHNGDKIEHHRVFLCKCNGR